MRIGCPHCGGVIEDHRQHRIDKEPNALDDWLDQETPVNFVENEVAEMLNVDVPEYPESLYQRKWASPVSAMLKALVGDRDPTIADAKKLAAILTQVYRDNMEIADNLVSPASFQQLAARKIRAYRTNGKTANGRNPLDRDYDEWERKHERAMEEYGDIIET